MCNLFDGPFENHTSYQFKREKDKRMSVCDGTLDS